MLRRFTMIAAMALIAMAQMAAAWTPALHAGEKVDVKIHVVVGAAAPKLERFAASELAALFKARFDADVATVADLADLPQSARHVILIGSPATNPAVKEAVGKTWPKLSDQGHVLKSVKRPGKSVLVVGGGSPVATLWAVYELGHHFGIRYLLDRDMMPVNPTDMKLDDLDQTFEPVLRQRCWQSMGSSPIGPASWGLAEHQKLVRQLAKLKYTRIVLKVHAWQPFVTYRFKNVPKTTGLLWPAQAFPVSGDTAGRAVFDGAPFFVNPAFASAKTYEDRIAAGSKLLEGILETATELGMQTGLSLDPLEFPKEFSQFVPMPKTIDQGLAVVPGSSAKLDDTVLSLARTQLETYQVRYPHIDAWYLRVPAEHAAEVGKLAPGKAKVVYVGTGAIPGVYSARLLTIGSSARRAALDAKKLSKVDDADATSLHLPLGSPTALPQMNLGHLHTLMSTARKAGLAGFAADSTFVGDTHAAAYYLSRGSFDAKVTPASAYEDLITPMCGEGVAPRLVKGFEYIEQATDLMDEHQPGFGIPQEGMFASLYEGKQPPPKWWGEVRDLYGKAMNEMYRGNTRAREGGRSYSLYYAKRFMFSFFYMNATEAVRKAAVAGAEKKAGEQVDQLDSAVTTIYDALDALRDVTRGNGERGIIATLNQYYYRPLNAALRKADQ